MPAGENERPDRLVPARAPHAVQDDVGQRADEDKPIKRSHDASTEPIRQIHGRSYDFNTRQVSCSAQRTGRSSAMARQSSRFALRFDQLPEGALLIARVVGSDRGVGTRARASAEPALEAAASVRPDFDLTLIARVLPADME